MWERAEEIDEMSVYKASFGDTPNKTRYYDPLNNVDLIPDIAKAVNVGASSGGAGYAFTPLVWDRKVVDITRKYTPLLALIAKVTNMGKTAEYYRITARGAATWQTEQGALTEADDTATAHSAAMKYLRITGRVTGVAQIAGAHFLDALQQQVVNKTQSMNEALEDAIVNGNSSTNTLQPDGLIVNLTSNTVDLTGSAIKLADVTSLVNDCFEAKGRPNLIVSDPYTITALINEMMQYAKYVNPYMSIAWGLEAAAINTTVGRIPMVASQFMPSTTGARRLLVLSTDYVERRVLQDVTFERLAKTEDAEKFMLKTYNTLINKFPEGMGQLYNIQ